jgi:hypothetical protein
MAENCTYIDGIGSTTAIDTAGEIVDLAGIDTSSLMGAPFNYEHKSDIPAQVCGKILAYKKIFSEKDCENDRHKYYWDKCKTPFLYVMGRLFDDKKDSSKEVAALFLDDSEHPNEQPMMGFSIEGSKVEKQGMIVTKSIARKITLTNAPANKQCIAEMVPAEPAKTDEDSIFKSEPSYVVELMEKSEPMKKAVSWSSGEKKGNAVHFNHPEHGTLSIHKQPGGEFHVKHGGALAGVGGKKGVFSSAKEAGEHAKNYMQSLKQNKVLGPQPHNRPSPSMKSEEMTKALTAGSGMAGPGNLVGGAALGKEEIDKKMKKSQKLLRAEQEYSTWAKREEFETFMAKNMPHLTKGEVTALGQTLCLSKSLKNEKKLAKIMARPSLNSWIDKKEKK